MARASESNPKLAWGLPSAAETSRRQIFDLWATYDILAKQIHAMEHRTGAAFVDPELHFGPYQRAQQLLAECQRREALRGNALQPAPTDD